MDETYPSFPNDLQLKKFYKNLNCGSNISKGECIFLREGVKKILKINSHEKRTYDRRFLLFYWTFGYYDAKELCRFRCSKNSNCINPYHIKRDNEEKLKECKRLSSGYFITDHDIEREIQIEKEKEECQKEISKKKLESTKEEILNFQNQLKKRKIELITSENKNKEEEQLESSTKIPYSRDLYFCLDDFDENG